jgi:hypothetical protein
LIRTLQLGGGSAAYLVFFSVVAFDLWLLYRFFFVSVRTSRHLQPLDYLPPCRKARRVGVKSRRKRGVAMHVLPLRMAAVVAVITVGTFVPRNAAAQEYEKWYKQSEQQFST